MILHSSPKSEDWPTGLKIAHIQNQMYNNPADPLPTISDVQMSSIKSFYQICFPFAFLSIFIKAWLKNDKLHLLTATFPAG